jgi:carbamoyltransferase
MIILGIHDGHESSVSLLMDGKIIYAAQEERFTRLKGDYGFPKNAINDCLKSTGITPKDIDEVALGSKTLNPVLIKLKRNANFSVSHWIEEQEKFWKPKIFQNKKVSYWNIFKNKKEFIKDSHYDYRSILKGYMSKKDFIIFRRRRVEKISKFLNLDISKVKVYLHEDCHKYYSYYFFPDRSDGIAITAEGIGDYSNGSVTTVKKENFKLISSNRDNHLGHIYQYITLLLGMKPAQHEYKVMGLAPYASKYETSKCFEIFDKILKVKNFNIVFDKKPKDLYFHFKENFKDCRFDGIAGASQKFLENKLSEWFLACSKKLKYKKIYFSGGVAQNIKAGMTLSYNKQIEKIFIPPAAGDTSISVGACFKSASNFCNKNKFSKNVYIKPIDNMYLGYQIPKIEIENFIKRKKIRNSFKIIENFSPTEVAREIFNGKIIGRCVDKMEFGLRSLGNRSILCDPRFFSNINKINSKIKKRDFWMPFTPTILKEDFNKFIINPKGLNSKFMSMAFRTTSEGKKNLEAAIHPADYTVRPQLLEKNDNPKYYEIIQCFK